MVIVVVKFAAVVGFTDTVTLWPAARVPDDRDRLSWLATLPGSDAVQCTLAPLAVIVNAEENGAATAMEDGDTVTAPVTVRLADGALVCGAPGATMVCATTLGESADGVAGGR